MRNFRDYEVWHLAHQLMLDVYDALDDFPSDERFVLVHQMKKASHSIPDNIAEGCGRFSDGDFRRFIEYASGSSKEIESQLVAARDLHFLPEPLYKRLQNDLVRVQRKLKALHHALR